MKVVFVMLFSGMIGCAFGQPVSAANAATFQEKVLYSFCSRHLGGRVCRDGDTPEASLVEKNGRLYGTTVEGGDHNGLDRAGGGTVFRLDPSTGSERVLHAFCRHDRGCKDGLGPVAGLIKVNGELLGTTTQGGFSGCYRDIGACGTVFSIDPTTETEKVLYHFCSRRNCTDGEGPAASLIDVGGILYGTTVGGGSGAGYCGDGCGTVFSLDPSTGAEKVLYSFCSQTNCTDGGSPESDLIDVNGVLYGTARGGGNTESDCGGSGCGTVFSLDLSTGAEKLVYSFCSQQNCTDGEAPTGSLIDVNGTLYGTTYSGGTTTNCSSVSGCGAVFSLDPSTGAEEVVYSFCGQPNCTDGRAGVGGLINVKGTLYGTTYLGGGTTCLSDLGCGTVFSVDPQTGAENVVYTFCSQQNCVDGANPVAGVISVNGVLYGTTESGGSNMYCSYTGQNGCGTVFALKKKR